MQKILPYEIAFDFDGVIADTFRLFITLAKLRYDVDIDYDSIREYEFIDAVDMDNALAMQIIDDLTFRSHELDLQPMDGAIATIRRLLTFSPQLIVTARPEPMPVKIWISRLIPEADGNIRVAATGHGDAKLEVLQKAGMRYFIDDRLDTCTLLAEHGITPIVFDQPWNREPHPFNTVTDWQQISAMIRWDIPSGDNSDR